MSESLAFRSVGDQAETVAQPLHRGPGHEDRSLQGERAATFELIKDGREHARGRSHLGLSRIGEQKAAGAIRRFQHAWRKTRLTIGRGLLVAGDAPDRDGHAEMLALRRAEIVLAVAELGKKRARNAEAVEQPVVPAPDLMS